MTWRNSSGWGRGPANPTTPQHNIYLHQDITTPGNFFTTLTEANSHNPDNPNPTATTKYSRLDQAETQRQPNGKLRFRATYTNLINAGGLTEITAEWEQTSNPFNGGTNPNTEQVTGYQLISTNLPGIDWRGICRSNSTSTWYDMNPNSTNWWGAIALRQPFSGNTFPATSTGSRTARTLTLEIL